MASSPVLMPTWQVPQGYTRRCGHGNTKGSDRGVQGAVNKAGIPVYDHGSIQRGSRGFVQQQESITHHT
ncbi:hypothetical protein O1611_g5348 [Lasiodiplodia mahajangana]|uniref:Uncharacterized protein n=1 Tax=Lasiodiplodia mahajangana TaxID=1108764 RepID=A0ACC2JLR1_9PEZI|nr:hypothetical protein O1611_g5348 [Lasiodiplodia mahajangana]